MCAPARCRSTRATAGELIAQGEEGHSDFGFGGRSQRHNRSSDLDGRSRGLPAAGFDLRAAPLFQRKCVLDEFLIRSGPIAYSEHIEGDAEAMMQACLHDGVSRVSSQSARCAIPFRPGRELSQDKMCADRPLHDHRLRARCDSALDAVRLARREKSKLVYVGKVKTGFTRKAAMTLRRQLDAIACRASLSVLAPLFSGFKRPTATISECVCRMEPQARVRDAFIPSCCNALLRRDFERGGTVRPTPTSNGRRH
jgi:hypothetical protein